MTLRLTMPDQPITLGVPFGLSFIIVDDATPVPPTPPAPPPVSGSWPPVPADGSIVSREVFNTAAFTMQPPPAAGSSVQVARKELLNDSGRDLLICSANLWTGVNLGGKCDSHCELQRKSDGCPIIVSQTDHYTDGERTRDKDFGANWMTLPAGDSLLLVYFAVDVSGGRGGQAHHTARIWWRYRT